MRQSVLSRTIRHAFAAPPRPYPHQTVLASIAAGYGFTFNFEQVYVMEQIVTQTVFRKEEDVPLFLRWVETNADQFSREHWSILDCKLHGFPLCFKLIEDKQCQPLTRRKSI